MCLSAERGAPREGVGPTKLAAGLPQPVAIEGRRPPYGFQLDPKGQLRPKPAEQRRIARIRRMRTERASLRKIGEESPA